MGGGGKQGEQIATGHQKSGRGEKIEKGKKGKGKELTRALDKYNIITNVFQKKLGFLYH